MTTLTWQDFLRESEEFHKISERLGDDWKLFKKNDADGNQFLIYKQKISCNFKPQLKAVQTAADAVCNKVSTSSALPTELLEMEYHVVYSISYQVPVLYFQAHRQDGSFLQLEDAWHVFCSSHAGSSASALTRSDLLNTLTQMEHPVLFRPFLALHPCRTAELLGQAGASANRVLTFISLMGPFLHLKLAKEYGLSFD